VRVLHLSDCYLPRLGGIETQVHGLARRQRAAGLDAEVVTATPRARHDRTPFEVVDGVPVHRTTVDLPYELPVHPHPGREVLQVARAGGFYVVHAHVGVVAPFARGALPTLVRAGVPVVVTVHSLWSGTTPLMRVAELVARWHTWPAVFTAVSEVAARPVRSVLGGHVDVGVLPNGIDAAAWALEPAPRTPGEVVIAAAMRLASRKRPLALLEVLRLLRERTPSSTRLRAVIAGEGPQRGAMERYRERHDLAWVSMPGRLAPADLRELYRGTDVYVVPSVLESFGIAALEARAAGLPVVARAETGVAEFVEHGVDGLLATSDAGLADAVTRLVADAGLRERIAAHNRAVPPSVTWDEVVARSTAAYERALGLLAAAWR
jgi:glycosyltransferase involved in cell wall biosynthesis